MNPNGGDTGMADRGDDVREEKPAERVSGREPEPGGQNGYLSGRTRRPRCGVCEELLLTDEVNVCDNCKQEFLRQPSGESGMDGEWVAAVAERANYLLRMEWYELDVETEQAPQVSLAEARSVLKARDDLRTERAREVGDG